MLPLVEIGHAQHGHTLDGYRHTAPLFLGADAFFLRQSSYFLRSCAFQLLGDAGGSCGRSKIL